MADQPPKSTGTFVRPEASVLPDDALVPAANLLAAPPSHMTHMVRTSQPWFFEMPEGSVVPVGRFDAGTAVAVTARGDRFCKVADAQGLHVWTACSGLVALP